MFDRVENIMGKDEYAGNQHFLLYPQCSQKAPSSLRIVKSRDCGKELINSMCLLLKRRRLLKTLGNGEHVGDQCFSFFYTFLYFQTKKNLIISASFKSLPKPEESRDFSILLKALI